MSESLLNAEQRKLFGQWVLCLRQRERTSAREAADMLEAALAEIDRLTAALADAEKLLAIVAQDEETGAAEMGAAREREACAVEMGRALGILRRWPAESAQDNVTFRARQAEEDAFVRAAEIIRARGPCLPQPAEEGELEWLRAKVSLHGDLIVSAVQLCEAIGRASAAKTTRALCSLREDLHRLGFETTEPAAPPAP